MKTKQSKKNTKNGFYIAGDVSATNISMEVFELNCRGNKFDYLGQTITNFNKEVLEDLLKKNKIDSSDIEAMVLSPAGIISSDGKCCEMTNAEFYLDASSYEIPTALINDYKAIAYGVSAHVQGVENVENLPLSHLDGSFGESISSEPIGIHGAGTGFGCGRLFFENGQYVPESSEGGHRLLTTNPFSEKENEITRYLSAKFYGGRIPHLESVLSGQGIEHVFEYLLARAITNGEINLSESEMKSFEKFRDKAEGISKLAKENPDSLFGEVDEFFYKIYGRALHDLAVHENARGGIWIAGGVLRKNILTDNGKVNEKISDLIMNEFDNGPSHRDWVNKIPVYAIMDKEIGLKGAKYVASNPFVFDIERYKIN